MKRYVVLAMMVVIAMMQAKGQEEGTVVGGYQPTMNPQQKATLYAFGNDDNSKFQFTAGYVNKSWICEYPNGEEQREDFFGDPNDQYFHGFQFGGLYTPAFDWGLGLRTGLYFEIYISQSKWIREVCNSFEEIDMYIPVHAMYRFSHNDFGFELFGGIGFQWAMSGRYYKYVGSSYYYSPWWYWYRRRDHYESHKQDYGNGWPKQVNWQAEIGLDIRYKMFGLSFTYAFGLVDMGIENTFDGGHTYITATKSRQDKMQASLIIFF